MKSITQLENIDKPREKLIKKGVKALKNYELLAVLLGSGVKGKDVISLSTEIIKLFEEDFEAWVHGPVCRNVYDIIKGKSILYSDVEYSEYDFDSDIVLKDIISSEQYNLLNDVLKPLSLWTGSELETATHNEAPWLIARGDKKPNENCSTIISKDEMLKFYSNELDGWN